MGRILDTLLGRARCVGFVIAAPRSGTTWLMTALNAHPQVFCTEQRLFGEFAEVWPNDDGTASLRVTLDAYTRSFAGHYAHKALGLNRAEFQERVTAELLDAVLDLGFRLSGKAMLVDKITPYAGTAGMVAQKIGRHFPAAKLARLLRDGRDVTVSGCFDWLLKDGAGTPRHAYFVERRPGLVLERFFDDAAIDRWAGQWADAVRATGASGHEVHVLRYERMLQDVEAELSGLLAAWNLDARPQTVRRCVEASTFERMSGGRVRGEEMATAPVRKGVSGEWKKYFTRRDGERFCKHAGDLLQALGYESGDAWIAALPERLELPAVDESKDQGGAAAIR